MKTLIRTALLFLTLTLVCIVAYNIIGSSVDSHGVLHEPFALIPLGWACLALALLLSSLWATITLVRRIARAITTHKNTTAR